MARAFVFAHRNPRQERPETSKRLCAIVHCLALRRELAQQQVIEARRLFGERDLGAHLERSWAAASEVALEADVPDDSFGAHGRGLRRTAAEGKLCAARKQG